MAHLGFLCPELSGHLNPMMSLARELERRGHRITFYQRPISCERVRNAGFHCQVYGEREFPIAVMKANLKKLAGLGGRAALSHTVRLFALQAKALIRDLPGMLQRDGIDLLLVDQAIGAGSTIAEMAGLPFVIVCNALALDEEPDVPPFCFDWPFLPTAIGRFRNRIGYRLLRTLARPVFRAMNDVRSARGLPEIVDFSKLAGRASAVVCQLPPEFDFPRKRLAPAFHYVGPMVDAAVRAHSDFPFDRLDGRPLIYASMGTLQNGIQRTFGIIARASHGLGCQLILSLGGGGEPAALAGLPGDPIVVKFAPQLDLIKRSTLCVTHAGLNTALECLSEGVPMAAIPITNDQPGVAARIKYVGAGEFVPIASLGVANLRAAIKAALRDGRYRDAARRMQAGIKKCGGARRGADVVEAAIG